MPRNRHLFFEIPAPRSPRNRQKTRNIRTFGKKKNRQKALAEIWYAQQRSGDQHSSKKRRRKRQGVGKQKTKKFAVLPTWRKKSKQTAGRFVQWSSALWKWGHKRFWSYQQTKNAWFSVFGEKKKNTGLSCGTEDKERLLSGQQKVCGRSSKSVQTIFMRKGKTNAVGSFSGKCLSTVQTWRVGIANRTF